MKKLFILCGAVAIVTALTGVHATKVHDVNRVIELQDSCVRMLRYHSIVEHNHNFKIRLTRDVYANQIMIDSIANVMWKEGCDLPVFDGDIKVLIEEEMNKLNNNN